ncbi:MAG TPA: SRPBCC family protein [Flavitalea sp.]|nr:SRPBCC family protein [Flavitalea sp.]
MHCITAVQRIPISIEEAWQFFSNPGNLQAITPPTMGFKIISTHHGDRMYAGQIIEYRVAPVFQIPLYWMTEITHVESHKYFVDEQRFGPYLLWHHQHHFKEIAGGVEMTDIVNYRLPLGFIGRTVNAIFVKNELKRIFDFRSAKVEELYGEWIEERQTGLSKQPVLIPGSG